MPLDLYRKTQFQPHSPLGEVLARHHDEILALAHAHKVCNVRVFGSVARGEDDEDSDIDLLVGLEPGADLLDLAALNIELEQLLGNSVDIVPARLLKPHVAQPHSPKRRSCNEDTASATVYGLPAMRAEQHTQ